MKDAIHAFWCAIRRYIRCDKAQWDFVEYEENDPHYATTIQKARQLELLEARTDLLTVGKELAESLKQHGHDSTAVLELRDAALHRPYRIEDLLPSLRIELEKVTIRESLKTTEEDPTFLGLHVDEADRIITRDGYPGESSDFGRKGRAWQLLHALWKSQR